IGGFMKAINIIFIILIFTGYAYEINADTFSPTVITSRDSNSAYATSQNAFYASNPNLAGQCTWYVYGRVIELTDKNELDDSVGDYFENAFWGESGRHAKNWPDFLGGSWFCTHNDVLPIEQRKKGLVAVWKFGDYGHVGFVEEISADSRRYRLTDFNRSNRTSYKDEWYKFDKNDSLGKNDIIGGVYPCFYDLKLAKKLALTSSITLTPSPIVQGAPLTVKVELINEGNEAFNGSIAAALHSDSGTFLGDIELKQGEILSSGYSRTYLFHKDSIFSAPGQYHIQIKYQSAGSAWDVVPEGNYTNPYPVPIVENSITPPPSSDYVWMGNGSIISYHGRLLPDYAGKDWPYGITQDVVKLHATANKAVGFFQWQVTEADCQQLKLDAEGLMLSQNQVDITIGTWNDRDDDITFSKVQLPFVLGGANTRYRFDMEEGHWYVVKVALLNRLTQEVKLNAYCTYEMPTDANYQRNGGQALMMDEGYQWQGNGSVISHMFRSLYGQRNNVGLNRDWPYGAFQDVTRIQRSSAKSMVFFQWQQDAVCSQLTLEAPQLSAFEKSVDIVVKPWNASPDEAMVYRNQTLPYTVYGDGGDGSWRLIQVKFLNAVGHTAEVSARCPGIN
ncbi:MAG: CHAP domain-containing protein, partial [Pseudomonadota bacterium]|nr:CHAP domain-containing protein [Pseudomonadota bacterium]